MPNFDRCIAASWEDEAPGYGDAGDGASVSDQILDAYHSLQRPHSDTSVLGSTEHSRVSRHLQNRHRMHGGHVALQRAFSFECGGIVDQHFAVLAPRNQQLWAQIQTVNVAKLRRQRFDTRNLETNKNYSLLASSDVHLYSFYKIFAI